MSLPAVAKASPALQQAPPDLRNLHWKSNNVGAKLLSKMGWKEGQAVGKRQRTSDTTAAATTSTAPSTSEGLRVVKRADNLGLGAKHSSTITDGGNHHVESFAALLKQLKNEHGNSDNEGEKKSSKKKSKKDKKKKSTATPILPTNKTTHHKVRAAKFQEKSADDMKCIFGGVDFAVIATTTTTERKSSKKRSKKDDDNKKTKKSKPTSSEE